MAFDPCDHKIRAIVIDFGKALRRVQGLPEEKNITILYKEALEAIGIIEVPITSREVNHFPAPHEMKNDKGKFIVPRKDCPQCGEKEAMMFGPLCRSCKDAEGGKYKSMWECHTCGHKEKLDKFFSQILNEMGVDFGSGTKEELGIMTFTDEGNK